MSGFAGVLDAVRAPADSFVDEILDGSNDLARAMHTGADTLTGIMIELFVFSVKLLGALGKVATAFLFFGFVGFGGYELLRFQSFFPQVAAMVLMILGFVPVVGGVIIGEWAILEAVIDRRRRPRRVVRSGSDDWVSFLLLDALVVCAIFLLRAGGVAFYSPLYSFF